MSTLGKLKQQKGRIRGQITRTKNAIIANPNMTKSEAEVRLQKLNEYWQEFGEIQTEIENIVVAPDQIEEFTVDNDAERLLFENAFFEAATKAQDIVNTENIRQENRRLQTNQNGQNGQQNTQHTGRAEGVPIRYNKPKLPDLKLPDFDGCWTKWLFFRNSFQAAIVNDTDLSNLQKHQYLIGVLKNEALKVVESFEINNENFTTVWQLLKDTYNNEMMIIESHLDQLLKMPENTQENKVDAMKAFIWHIKTHLQSLKALNQPLDQWNTIIIHLAKKKLEFTEQKEWQEKVKDKTRNHQCNQNAATISGINQAQTKSAKTIQLKIQSRIGGFEANINCVVLSSITKRLPQSKIDSKKIKKLKNVELADPQYKEPDNIDVLIGAGLYWQLVTGNPVVAEGQPTWQNTKLGWILGGEIQNSKNNDSKVCFKVTNTDLNNQLEKFWLLETLPETVHYTKEESQCEQHFIETFSRNSNGRFIVRLPMRQDVSLGESRSQAMRRLLSIERRFQKNQEMKKSYVDFMQDYLDQEHMTLVENTAVLKAEESFHIPHQPVIKPDSITTKLRVVFDASAKTSKGTSLNDKLIQGPNLQGDLFKILVRFRTHEVVITGDIAQMYRQILIHPTDRQYQLILWREDPTQSEKTYRLNTVTYGTACAPFHALRCMKQLARDHQDQYPLPSKVIEQDLYMDDALSGGKTEKEVMQIQKELIQLLIQGQFVMRKWRSNKREILQKLERLNDEGELMVLDKEEAVKTLGLLWNSRQDWLQYQVTLTNTAVETKRSTLSKVSQIYDPLGLVAPVLINGKLFMQKLWMSDLEWDDPLPAEQAFEWENYYSSLPTLSDLVIQRNINPENEENKFNIHGFADASEKAFGACIYGISKTTKGKNSSPSDLC